ncbi:MAG: GyrI-like domain-containing protein [Methanoregulaceae archaeon]|jgi:effector-binding domain-containing protein|nr:GyrI-like domain-containing protein [Methanoregulaceae archaeon]
MDEITIIDVPSQQVVGIQKTGTYLLIPELLMKLYEFIVEKKLTITGMPTFLCHETSPECVKEANEKGTANVEVVWPISGTVQGSGAIRVYELPGGRMVRAVHRGPYETCESTYLSLFSWIESHHLRIAGPIREMYPNDPREVKPEEILTEILVPVY